MDLGFIGLATGNRTRAKTVRIGLFSTALLAALAAQAREFPRAHTETAPDGCAIFGPGFHKVEGTGSCVKVSGQVRVESDYNSSGATGTPGIAVRSH